MKAGLFGDSQGQGLSPHLRTALRERGIELSYVSVRPGFTTARFLDAETGAPEGLDLAIVVLGGNDTGSTGGYVSVLTRAAAFFGARARKTLWIGPSYSLERSVEARHAVTREAQARVLPQLGVTFWDPLNWQVGDAAAHRETDGTHFARDAYELQALAIADEASLLLTRGRVTVLALGLAVAAGLGAWAWQRLRPAVRARRIRR